MKLAAIVLVTLGVIAAISAALLVQTLARPRAASAASAEPSVEILTATRDLPANGVVDSSAVATMSVPKSQVPPGAVLNSVQVVGKIVTRPVLRGEAFTSDAFAREGAGVYLAGALPPGKRAMSVSLADWSGMAGLLYPGSVVDVLVMLRTPGADAQAEQAVSTTLLQGLQVLAIGSQSIAGEEYVDKKTGALSERGQINHRMVTLLVDPKQAEILQLAMQNGTISLAMRNPLDDSRQNQRLTHLSELTNNAAYARQQQKAGDPAAVLATFTQPAPPAPKAAEPPAPATAPSTVPAPQAADRPDEIWRTYVIKGERVETRSFEMVDGEPTGTRVDTPQARR